MTSRGSGPPSDSRVVERLVVLRAQLGDPDAHAELFRAYHPRLVYFARRLLGSHADAEEVVQETWLRVVRKVATLDDPGAFRGWLYRIARNLALSRLRRRHPEVALGADPDADEAPVPPELIEPEGADLDLLRSLDVRRVHAGLEALTPAHREVLTLRFLEDLPYEEIAEVVGTSVGTVRSRIHYARRSLRTAIDPKGA